MNSLFTGGAIFLFALPTLIAEWIGVVLLAKNGRTGEWWSMLAGAALTTLGPIAQMLSVFLVHLAGNGSYSAMTTAMMISGAISTLGSLLFTVGFAMHAARISRIRSRITELELMNLAQATELEQIRNR